jgi:hypothetical protein
MEKEFIPYEQALALKELGFDEECVSFYSSKGKLYQSEGYYKFGENVFGEEVIAPLYQQAFRWFREKYELDSYIRHECPNVEPYYDFVIDEDVFDVMCDYEEAELECLKKLIEIVKNK